jgi:hypothetical protein
MKSNDDAFAEIIRAKATVFDNAHLRPGRLDDSNLNAGECGAWFWQ